MTAPLLDEASISFKDLMSLDQLSDMTFRSKVRPFDPGASNRAYGGHVYAQAVYAAAQTIRPTFVVHNVTGWFILPGVIDTPFVFGVRKIRDGGSYSTRAVDVKQKPEAGVCFTCICSFKKPERSAYTHSVPMAFSPKYDCILKDKRPEDHPLAPGVDTHWYYKRATEDGMQDAMPGADIRKVDMKAYNSQIKSPAEYRQLSYYRARGSMPEDDINLQACLHLYASDRNSLFIICHALGLDNFQAMASLSHTVIFHVLEDGVLCRNEGWFCQEAWTERSGDGRGIHQSRLWSEGGVHVASTIQDGLVRVEMAQAKI
ncbi:MAG: hypothetical protein M1834_000483 [Cirrosporium novae-zelandiae]|nr:MAG: hypothetical protein M1834_000483 [Cirrosporium novae-zelandiae]